MTQWKKIFLTLTMLGILTFVTACATDLTSVHKWSSTSLEATQYNELVTTYANTPERLKRYDPSQQWDEQIDSRKSQSKALKKLLAIVSDYMSALAILSADSTVDYSKDADTLKKSIRQLNAGITPGEKQVSEETLGAAGSLVEEILNAAVKVYQAKQVANIIEHANEPLQKIIGQQGYLFQIIDKDFRRDLKIESTAIDGFYDNLSRKGNASDAAKEAMVEWKEVRLNQNAKQLKAMDAYLEVLKKIAIGHQKLYDHHKESKGLDDEYLVKQLHALVVELRKQIQILSQS